MACSSYHTLHARHSIWEAKPCEFPRETIASAIIKASRSVDPSSAAIRGPTGNEVSYAQFVRKAFNIAKLLKQRPLDSYVGILVPRDVQHPLCVLGVMLSGAAFLPMSSTIPEDRKKYIIEDSGCDTIITTKDYSTQLDDWFNGTVILYDDVPDEDTQDTAIDDMIARVDTSNLAYAIYTSGTTGKPKGVEVEHLGVLNMLAHHKAESISPDQIKKCVIVASFIFDSSIREMFLPLTSGTCLCIAENVLNISEGTCCGGTPSGLAVAQIPSSMKAALIGGERLTTACVKHLKALETIVNVYGPTELTVECTTHMTDVAKESEIALIGLPIRNASAYAADKDSKQLVDKGEQGELWISGPGVARGYRNRPDLNQDKFIANPWKEGERLFRTGDLVKWAPSGDIEFLGRTDSQVKLRGYRIELEEIERVCSEVPGVKNACVIVAKDLRNADQIVAFVEPPVDETSVTEFCGAKMPPYMVPARVMGVEKFPLTTSGKIDKRQLPEVVWAAPVVDADDMVEPATPMERALCNLMESIFEIKCSADADFFNELGLTSLDCAALVAEARAIDIQIGGTGVCLANPTVQKLAKHLMKDQDQSEVEKRARRRASHEMQGEVDGDTMMRLLGEPLNRKLQWFVYGSGFVLQMWLCYLPPAAITTLIFCETFFRGRGGSWDAMLSFKVGDGVTLDGGWVATMATIPVVFALVTPFVLLWTIMLKWLIIGRYKTGMHAVGSWYYVRWWLVHGFITFNNVFILPVLRNTFVINWYYRCLGMKIGKGTLIDTTAILEPDLITVGDNCRLQSDCLVNGHALRWVPEVQGQCLCLQRIEIDDDVVVGPGCTVAVKDGVTTIRVSGDMPALTSAQMLPEDYEDFKDQVLWQPKISCCVQIFGMLFSGLLHWISLAVPVTVLFVFFLGGIHRVDGQLPTWDPDDPTAFGSKTHAWFVLWWVHFYWMAGLPYIFLVLLFKWTVIFKFREGPSTRGIDNKRFLLQMLVQSRLLQNTVFLGASSHIIILFFRFMGAHVGWNAQVMPCTIVEFDLLSIGDCVAFGGLVSWFPRDKEGNMKSIEIGNYSAVTNSAVVMAGTKVGENSLVGNLTLCTTDCVVPDHTKAVGNPMIQFGNDSDPVELHRTRSNIVMFCHLIGSYLVELVDVPPFMFNIFIGGQYCYGPLRKAVTGPTSSWVVTSLGYLAEVVLLVPSFAIMIVLTVIVFRRYLCPRLVGTHLRDSWVFLEFIYFTKVMVSTDAHVFRMLNGTPFMPLIYNLMGGNMALSSLLFFRHCADFDELTIGENAIVDFDSYLEMHQKTATELMYEPVEIGTNAVVGQRSILLRGSMLSQDSIVFPNTTVLPGEEVPQGSFLAMNPGRLIPKAEKTGESGDIVKASAKGGRNSIAGIKAAARHGEAAARDQGGFTAQAGGRASIARQGGPGGRASTRAGGRASTRAGGRASTRAGGRASTRGGAVGEAVQEADKMEIGERNTVDHVIVGAGVCGLIMAKELTDQRKSYMVLEKSDDIMGCWNGKCAANKTSHVAVSEPSYRFDYDHKGKYPSDFTGRDELVADARRYVTAHDINVSHNSNVTLVEQKGKGWTVSYVKDNKLCTVDTKGVFLALGAQQIPRSISYDGEDSFEGTVSSGIRDHMPLEKFEGARVVIVGGGAFACENLRTALLHGAEHVTMCYRTALQCWPRLVHYQATLGDITLGELGTYYETACKWAGLDGKLEPFMSKKCTAQPTASDIFFIAYKAGRLTLKNTVITSVRSRSVCLKDGSELPCDVLMKCLGWAEPPVKKVMPEFTSRRFVFLNGQASCAFVSDPHYQHKGGSNRGLAQLKEVKIKGGTFSVLALATVSAKLQLYFMDHPEEYAKAMAQLPESPEPVCSWFQQRWDFDDLPEVNKIIDDTLNKFKTQAREKFAGTADYVAMAEKRAEGDTARWLSRFPGYIFKPDGSGNYFDMPDELKYDSDKIQRLIKDKDQMPQGSSLQQNAYKAAQI